MQTRLLAVIVILLFLSACRHERLDVDISNISLKLHIDRFERDLFAADTVHPESSFNLLAKRYPTFLPLFVQNIAMAVHKGTPGAPVAELKNFVSAKDLRGLKKDVDSVYPNLDTQQTALQNAFKHYRYYYPHGAVPHIITFISGFNNAIVNTDTDLGIGLDMFMGSTYKYYASVNFPRYLARTLNKEHLVQTAMKGFAKQTYPPQATSTLLSNMIYEGKILYFLDAVMPGSPDSAKIGYSQKQLDWCRGNESNIWSYAVEADKLFSSERKVIENFFEDGPFTTGLSQQSPPRLGMYVGWQIVRKYMDENPSVTVQSLMDEKDERKILQGSAYKP